MPACSSERIIDALRRALRDRRPERQDQRQHRRRRLSRPTRTTPSDLIKNADMALYRAKAEGRGFTRFYEAAMDEALRQRRQLEADLCLAIGRERAQGPLSAARRARQRRDHRLRSAAALGPSAARLDQPGDVHPARRGKRADHQARRMGAARGVHARRRAGIRRSSSRSTSRRCSSCRTIWSARSSACSPRPGSLRTARAGSDRRRC